MDEWKDRWRIYGCKLSTLDWDLLWLQCCAALIQPHFVQPPFLCLDVDTDGTIVTSASVTQSDSDSHKAGRKNVLASRELSRNVFLDTDLQTRSCLWWQHAHTQCSLDVVTVWSTERMCCTVTVENRWECLYYSPIGEISTITTAIHTAERLKMQFNIIYIIK